MTVERPPILTGSDALDQALGGGFPEGSTLLIEGPNGVGSTELALTMLRAASRDKVKRRAVFASAIRSGVRAAGEAQRLLGGPRGAGDIEFVALPRPSVDEKALALVAQLARGDVIVFESACALERRGPQDLLTEQLGEVAHRIGIVAAVLHTPGSLDRVVEARVSEAVDAIFTFNVHESGSSRRRSLTLTKLRGLGPGFDGEKVPVFEASMRQGDGFAVSRIHSVV